MLCVPTNKIKYFFDKVFHSIKYCLTVFLIRGKTFENHIAAGIVLVSTVISIMTKMSQPFCSVCVTFVASINVCVQIPQGVCILLNVAMERNLNCREDFIDIQVSFV